MKRKKFLALALAGVMTAATLTACAPLDAAELLYDWFFGGGSSNASRGSGTGLVTESVRRSKSSIIGLCFDLTERHQAKAPEPEPTLQAVAKRL